MSTSRPADPPEEPTSDLAPAGPARSRRTPSRRMTVLAGLFASALLAGATRMTWVQASAPDLAGTTQDVAVKGTDAAPAVLAVAIVAVAAALATTLSSTWVRFVTGPVLLAAGLAGGYSAVMVSADPISASGSAVAGATGVLGSQVQAQATAWPLLTLLPALAVAATGLIVLVAGRTWPVGTRYRSAAVTVTADPAEDPAAAWDALTRGEDPSADVDARAEPGPESEPGDGAQRRASGQQLGDRDHPASDT
ncbi:MULTISPECIES: Trp biosynthesis-associated membrane protein [unclassified Brachybacterium]|uniref:Trp biosynthesis-associated membrane protein n=1 Tax=unclassified Brachybacterium TaxID=2623841 RepID=UPI0036175CBF